MSLWPSLFTFLCWTKALCCLLCVRVRFNDRDVDADEDVDVVDGKDANVDDDDDTEDDDDDNRGKVRIVLDVLLWLSIFAFFSLCPSWPSIFTFVCWSEALCCLLCVLVRFRDLCVDDDESFGEDDAAVDDDDGDDKDDDDSNDDDDKDNDNDEDDDDDDDGEVRCLLDLLRLGIF